MRFHRVLILHKPKSQAKTTRLTRGSLNLTAATYVHIIEPQWNPMVEAQAAARIDRLDQTKDIVIIRYIVEHSIEEVRRRHKYHL